MSKKYLYYFSEGSQAFGGNKTAMRNTLGGKGSGLAEMTATSSRRRASRSTKTAASSTSVSPAATATRSSRSTVTASTTSTFPRA